MGAVRSSRASGPLQRDFPLPGFAGEQRLDEALAFPFVRGAYGLLVAEHFDVGELASSMQTCTYSQPMPLFV